jgi:hypothetical protein
MLVIKREDQTVDISTQIDADIILNSVGKNGFAKVVYVKDGLPFYVDDTWWYLDDIHRAWREQ